MPDKIAFPLAGEVESTIGKIKGCLKQMGPCLDLEIPFHLASDMESTTDIIEECLERIAICCELAEKLVRLNSYDEAGSSTKVMLLLTEYGSEGKFRNKIKFAIADLGRKLIGLEGYIREIREKTNAGNYVCPRCQGSGTTSTWAHVRERGSRQQTILRSRPCNSCSGKGLITLAAEVNKASGVFCDHGQNVLSIMLNLHNSLIDLVSSRYTQMGFEKKEVPVIAGSERAREEVYADVQAPVEEVAMNIPDVTEIAEEQEMNATGLLVGFLALHEDPAEDSFVEAILITDKNGYPLEYRFTEKISISKIQRILYGNTLRPYLIHEVVGLKLLKELDNPPSVILVVDEDLLALREKSECPILLLEEDKTSLKAHDKHPDDIERTRSALESYKEQIPLSQPFHRIFEAIERTD